MARALELPQRFILPRFELSPAQTITVGFASVILAGGILLSLPIASSTGQGTPFLDALFTATSATCVTGLVVVDTADHYSRFGQLVILALIQLGGLGYMAAATLLALLFGRRIGLQGRLALQEAYGLDRPGGVVRLTRSILLITLVIEGTGAALLALRWIPEFGLGKGIYYGIFHAVSAFNNAGFDLMGGFRSLTGYVNDTAVNLIITSLIIVGGLGYIVLLELPSLRRPGRRPSLHAMIVLVTTFGLIAAGTVLILLLEGRNPNTLGRLSWPGRLLAAYFQSVTPRTAGFNTVDIGKMSEPALFIVVALMFIGASPGGTGGGIKTTTFSSLFAPILAVVRGYQDADLFSRRIPPLVIYKALTIVLISIAFVFTMAVALTLVQPKAGFLPALLEIVSAFGTVGLSTGITPHLPAAGKIIVMLTVFGGRVGLLTLVLALRGRQRRVLVRYPEESVLVG
ncbi:MAG: Trk family potassium uptake protein [Armatimonadetes bacterium]|nr:Trk family potassium uptake protein [Armatimonadota bacterium]